MAYKLFRSLKKHQLIAAFAVLLVCIPPIFHLLMFFWPLLVSTALGVLAVVSFRRQTEKQHAAEIAEGDMVESSRHTDLTPVPPSTEKISNVLMVGNQEVTWLEWLHYEDQKLSMSMLECQEPSAWDTCGYDFSDMSSKERGDAAASTIANDRLSSTISSDGSTICRDEAANHVCAWKEDENRPDRPIGQDKHAAITGGTASTASNGFCSTAVITNDLSEDKVKMNVAMVSSDETDMDVDSTGDDRTCGIGSSREDAIARHTVKQEGIAPPAKEQCEAGVPACLNGQASLNSPPTDRSTPSLSDMKHRESEEGGAKEKNSKQPATQAPQWDASDGEEDQNCLRFSFLHSTCSKA